MGILQVFDSFYAPVPAGITPEPGHVYWVPTPNVEEVPKILDAERATPTEHEITSFEIREIRRLNLGDTEELMVAKAKKRLVVVLASITTDGISTLPDGTQKRLAKHLEKPSYLVAPLYSASSVMNPGTFGPVLVARIRALQYPHFFCLPDKDHTDQPRSIVRLDRVFPTHLGRGSEPKGERIHEEPFEIILSQFSILCGSVYHEPYDLAKELVKEALPPDLDATGPLTG
jgi:hypothetical protein